jgi:hypothetical protein
MQFMSRSVLTAMLLACGAAAQQSITFNTGNLNAIGFNQSKLPSRLMARIGDVVAPVQLAANQTPAQISKLLEEALSKQSFTTVRVNPTVFQVLDAKSNNGATLASDDLGLQPGLRIGASAKVTPDTKTFGVAIPGVDPGFVSQGAGKIAIEIADELRQRFSIVVPVKIGDTKPILDQLIADELVRAGLVVRAVSWPSLVRPTKFTTGFGIDRTVRGVKLDELIFIAVSLPALTFEATAGWLPRTGFAEYGEPSLGGLKTAPAVEGDGDPTVGQTYAVR